MTTGTTAPRGADRTPDGTPPAPQNSRENRGCVGNVGRRTGSAGTAPAIDSAGPEQPGCVGCREVMSGVPKAEVAEERAPRLVTDAGDLVGVARPHRQARSGGIRSPHRPCFRWLMSFRRVQTRHERLCHLSDGFTALARAFIALNRL